VRAYWERGKRRGFRSTARRVREELVSPKFGWSKRISRGSLHFRQLIRLPQDLKEAKMCYAIYDLNLYPTSFDFAYFLAAAQIHAIKNELTEMFVVFVPRENTHLASDESNHYSAETVAWRINNILIPLTQISPLCTGYALFSSERESYDFIRGKTVFPENTSQLYKPRWDMSQVFSDENMSPRSILEAPNMALKYIGEWSEANQIVDPMVTITIRTRNVDNTRNSDHKTWIDFAHWLKDRGYVPVFVPDTDAAWSVIFDDFHILAEASYNLALRQGLYESAFTNFFVTNGPAAGAVLNRSISYVMTGLLIEGSEYASPSQWDRIGVAIGSERFSFAGSHQLILWDPPELENLIVVFKKLEHENSRPVIGWR